MPGSLRDAQRDSDRGAAIAAMASYERGLRAALAAARGDLRDAAAARETAVAGSAWRLLATERDALRAAETLAACRGACGPEHSQLRATQVARARAVGVHERSLRARIEQERLAATLLVVLRETAAAASVAIPDARAAMGASASPT